MPLSDEIFERVVPPVPVPAGLPMVVLLTGFTDAGSVVQAIASQLRDTAGGEPLGLFDNDELLDYRARRPIVTFDRDHLTDYRPPRLEVSLAHDVLGQRFILVSGYEPDFAWEAFADVVVDLADEYQVASVTWLHAIGMPVPHTRPIGVSMSGNRGELIEALSVWQPHTQIPATAAHLLEYRLAAADVPVLGIVLLIPHYLAESEYPAAVLAGYEKMTAATGLVFATESLTDENREFLAKVDEQVSDNEELQRMLSGLESRYDAYRAGRLSAAAETDGASLLSDAPLPSADELAAELERYLATRPRHEGDDPTDRP